jgi:uncharacterized protein YeaO (DUF488 family)
VNGFQVENMVEGLLAAATIVLIFYSPIARAIGQRILHGRLPPPGVPADDGRVDELSGEVAALRHHLDEAQERIDFTERMLAQSREKNALPSGKET